MKEKRKEKIEKGIGERRRKRKSFETKEEGIEIETWRQKFLGNGSEAPLRFSD